MKRDAVRCGSPEETPCERLAHYSMTIIGPAGRSRRAWCRRCLADSFRARGFSYGFNLLDRKVRPGFKIVLEGLKQ
jgi:hypothetical protein